MALRNAWLSLIQYPAAVLASIAVLALEAAAKGSKVAWPAIRQAVDYAIHCTLASYVGARLLMAWRGWSGLAISALMGTVIAATGGALAGTVISNAAIFNGSARVRLDLAVGGVVGGAVHWGLSFLLLQSRKVAL